ncbi:MAG: hypothetical protein QM523_06630, partial [Candidatus Pacebacteria bacterium]|nr:hypothetical protein [Candidatus Paceibacterota bacterium]
AAADTVKFWGTNSFTSLTLNTTGSVTQDVGSSLTVSGTFLANATSGAITLGEAGNSFATLGGFTSAGVINLTSSAAVTLTGNLTSSGAISLTAAGLSLSSNVTTSGGAVTIDLDRYNYVNGATGYWLDTSNKNLTLKTASIFNTSAPVIFKLGTGSLSFGTGSTVGNRVQRTGVQTRYTVGAGYTGVDANILAAIEGASGTITTYSFANANTGTLTDSNATLNLPGAALAASGLVIGTKETVSDQGVLTAGLLKDSSGNVTWVDTANATYNPATNISLATGKEMVIAGVTVATATTVTAFAPTTISFSGTNSFSGNLALTSDGTISQAGGSSLTVTGTFSAIVISNGAITLGETGNSFAILGPITSRDGTNGVTIYSSRDFTISDNISAAGIASMTSGRVITLSKAGGLSLHTGTSINLNATGLTLGSNVTTSGGDVTMNLGTGTYTDGGFTLTNSIDNLTINLGRYILTATVVATSFDLGTGQFSSTITKSDTVPLDTTSVGNGYLLDVTKVRGTIATNSITSRGIITIQGLTYNGALRVETTAGANIILNGTNSFDKNLDLDASGAITQSGGTIAFTDSNGKLSMTARGGSISLNKTGNNFKVIDGVSSTRTVEIWNNGDLKLNGNITAGGAITIDLTKNLAADGSGNLTLLNNITTSGGAVTLNLGTGTYKDDGKLLTTTNQDLTLNLGKYSLTRVAAAPSVVAISFDLGSGQFSSTITKTGAVLLNNTSITGGDLLDSTRISFTGVGKIARNSLTTTGTIEFGNLTYSTLLSVAAGSAITQTTGTTLAISDVLSLSTTIGSITLDRSGNSNIKLGTISAGGAGKTVTIYNNGDLSLNGSIIAGGAITIDLRQNAAVPTGSGNLTLLNDVTTSGGAVTLNLGSGEFISGANSLTTSNQTLTLNLGKYTLGSGIAFRLGTANLSSTITKTGDIPLGSTSVADGHLLDVTKVQFGGGGLTENKIISSTGNVTITGLTYTPILTIETEVAGKTISFNGINRFDNNLTLSSKGNISQSGGSLTVSGTLSATVKTSGEIKLSEAGNSFATIGALTSLGSGNGIALSSTTALILMGDVNSAGTIALTSGAGMSLIKARGLTLTSVGPISLNATGLYLGSAVTSTGGTVTINLGIGNYTAGVSTGTTPFDWTLSGNNLILTADNIYVDTAGRINAPVDGAILFQGFTNSGGSSSLGIKAAVITPEAGGTDSLVISDSVTVNGTTPGSAVTYTGTGFYWMHSSSLTTGINRLATAGLRELGRNVIWASAPIPATLPTNQKIILFNVNLSGTTAVTITTSDTGGIVLNGTNSFGGNLTLTASAGAINQAGGTLTIGGSGELTASGTSVSLDKTGNSLRQLGVIGATSGVVTIGNNGSLSLNGAISAGGGITINLTGGNLTLAQSVTTSGGAVTMTLGTGQFIANGKILTTDNQNLTISLGGYNLTTAGSGINLGTGFLSSTIIKTGDIPAAIGTDNLLDSSKFTGNVTSNILKSDGNITINGLNYGLSLSLETTGSGKSITQSGGTIVMTGTSVLSLITTDGNISLNQTGNSLNRLGTVTARGTVSTVTIWNNGDLSLGGNITANGAITIDLTKGVLAAGIVTRDLTLRNNISTIGAVAGGITITLGSGTYYDGGKTLTTNGKNLTISLGGYGLTDRVTSLAMGGGGFRSTITKTGAITLDTTSIASGDLFNADNITFTSGGIVENKLITNGAITFGTLSYGAILSLEAGGAITQTAGTSLTTVDVLNLTTTIGSITLDQSGNSIAKLGTVTAGGAGKTVTIFNNGNLELSGPISAGGAITIDLTRGVLGNGNLTLSDNITTSGGAVTINLGTGQFINSGKSFTTSNNSLTISLGSYNLTVEGSGIFLGSGNLHSTIVVNSARTLGSAAGQISSSMIFNAGQITTTGSKTLIISTSAALTVADIILTEPITFTLPAGREGSVNFTNSSSFTDLKFDVKNGGAVTQTATSSIIVSGIFTAESNGSITLNSAANEIKTLGMVSSTKTTDPLSRLSINLGAVETGSSITDDITNRGGGIDITVGGKLTIGKSGVNGLTITSGNNGTIVFNVKDVTLTSNINTVGGAVSLLGAEGKTYTDGGKTFNTNHRNLTISHSIFDLTTPEGTHSFSEGSGTKIATFTPTGIGVESTEDITIRDNQALDKDGNIIPSGDTLLDPTKINFKTTTPAGFKTTKTLTIEGEIANSNFFKLSADRGIKVTGAVTMKDRNQPLFLISTRGNIEFQARVTARELNLTGQNIIETGGEAIETDGGAIETTFLTARAGGSITLKNPTNKVTTVRSMTSLLGDIDFGNSTNLAILGMSASNGRLNLQVKGTITSSVSLTGYNTIDIIATKLHWASNNLQLGTRGANGKVILIPTYNKQYLENNVAGHIWITLSQPVGSDPDNIVNNVVTIVAPISNIPATTVETIAKEVVLDNGPIQIVTPVATVNSGFGRPTVGDGQGVLFTVSSSASAEARPELKIGNISMPRLRASMNTTISSSENDESLTEDYYIPLAGNSALW